MMSVKSNYFVCLLVLTVLATVVGCERSAVIYQNWPFEAREAGRKQDETAIALGIPKELTLDLGKNVKMNLVLIPAGTFRMGISGEEPTTVVKMLVALGESWNDVSVDAMVRSESPQHTVTISKPFYMGVYAVTQEQYEQVMGKNPSRFKGTTNPVETVSWDDAVEFCKTLSMKTGYLCVLPTEAQYEYSCRAGTTTAFNMGDTIRSDQANYNGLKFGATVRTKTGFNVYGYGGKDAWRRKTTPVGSFKPNAWGLYDMHGNVWQWCQDRYDKDYYKNSPRIDPAGPGTGFDRVERGGDWRRLPVFCRSASRGYAGPGLGYDHGGLRVVVVIGKEHP